MANEYVLTSGTPNVANWVRDIWLSEIGISAYEEQRIAPFFRRLPVVEGRVIFRKHANLARQLPADSTVLTPLTFSGATEARYTKTPLTSYCAVAVNQNVIARVGASEPTFRRSIEMSMAEGVDVECGKAVDDLVNVKGGAGQDVTEAVFLDCLVTLAENAKNEWKPGTSEGIFIFHPRQLDDVLSSTQNWARYDVTGQTDGPIPTGMLKSAYGIKFVESGNIQNIGGVFHNPIFIPQMTFGIGYNQEPTVTTQERDLITLVIGWADFAAATLWDVYGVDFNTQTAA